MCVFLAFTTLSVFGLFVMLRNKPSANQLVLHGGFKSDCTFLMFIIQIDETILTRSLTLLADMQLRSMTEPPAYFTDSQLYLSLDLCTY